MTPEHLVDSAKLYDYYVNRFKEGGSTNVTCVHLLKVMSSSSSLTPAIYSAPSSMDLLNADTVEPQSTAAREEFWFNNPDPYMISMKQTVLILSYKKLSSDLPLGLTLPIM